MRNKIIYKQRSRTRKSVIVKNFTATPYRYTVIYPKQKLLIVTDDGKILDIEVKSGLIKFENKESNGKNQTIYEYSIDEKYNSFKESVQQYLGHIEIVKDTGEIINIILGSPHEKATNVEVSIPYCEIIKVNKDHTIELEVKNDIKYKFVSDIKDVQLEDCFSISNPEETKILYLKFSDKSVKILSQEKQDAVIGKILLGDKSILLINNTKKIKDTKAMQLKSIKTETISNPENNIPLELEWQTKAIVLQLECEDDRWQATAENGSIKLEIDAYHDVVDLGIRHQTFYVNIKNDLYKFPAYLGSIIFTNTKSRLRIPLWSVTNSVSSEYNFSSNYPDSFLPKRKNHVITVNESKKFSLSEVKIVNLEIKDVLDGLQKYEFKNIIANVPATCNVPVAQQNKYQYTYTYNDIIYYNNIQNNCRIYLKHNSNAGIIFCTKKDDNKLYTCIIVDSTYLEILNNDVKVVTDDSIQQTFLFGIKKTIPSRVATLKIGTVIFAKNDEKIIADIYYEGKVLETYTYKNHEEYNFVNLDSTNNRSIKEYNHNDCVLIMPENFLHVKTPQLAEKETMRIELNQVPLPDSIIALNAFDSLRDVVDITKPWYIPIVPSAVGNAVFIKSISSQNIYYKKLLALYKNVKSVHIANLDIFTNKKVTSTVGCSKEGEDHFIYEKKKTLKIFVKIENVPVGNTIRICVGEEFELNFVEKDDIESLSTIWTVEYYPKLHITQPSYSWVCGVKCSFKFKALEKTVGKQMITFKNKNQIKQYDLEII